MGNNCFFLFFLHCEEMRFILICVGVCVCVCVKCSLEVFNSTEFDYWVAKAVAPAIYSSLKLYEEIRELGIKVFLLTGRSERHRGITVENLKRAGFQEWDKLILRYSYTIVFPSFMLVQPLLFLSINNTQLVHGMAYIAEFITFVAILHAQTVETVYLRF